MKIRFEMFFASVLLIVLCVMSFEPIWTITISGQSSSKIGVIKWSDLLIVAPNKGELNKGEFPEILKIAEVIPIYKKANEFEKDNYRPISILSNISKIYELCIIKQMISL